MFFLHRLIVSYNIYRIVCSINRHEISENILFILRQLDLMSFYIKDHHKQVFIHTIWPIFMCQLTAISRSSDVMAALSLSLSVCLQNLSIYIR